VPCYSYGVYVASQPICRSGCDTNTQIPFLLGSIPTGAAEAWVRGGVRKMYLLSLEFDLNESIIIEGALHLR
jgi:hypothetical protein